MEGYTLTGTENVFELIIQNNLENVLNIEARGVDLTVRFIGNDVELGRRTDFPAIALYDGNLTINAGDDLNESKARIIAPDAPTAIYVNGGDLHLFGKGENSEVSFNSLTMMTVERKDGVGGLVYIHDGAYIHPLIMEEGTENEYMHQSGGISADDGVVVGYPKQLGLIVQMLSYGDPIMDIRSGESVTFEEATNSAGEGVGFGSERTTRFIDFERGEMLWALGPEHEDSSDLVSCISESRALAIVAQKPVLKLAGNTISETENRDDTLCSYDCLNSTLTIFEQSGAPYEGSLEVFNLSLDVVVRDSATLRYRVSDSVPAGIVLNDSRVVIRGENGDGELNIIPDTLTDNIGINIGGGSELSLLDGIEVNVGAENSTPEPDDFSAAVNIEPYGRLWCEGEGTTLTCLDEYSGGGSTTSQYGVYLDAEQDSSSELVVTNGAKLDAYGKKAGVYVKEENAYVNIALDMAGFGTLTSRCAAQVDGGISAVVLNHNTNLSTWLGQYIKAIPENETEFVYINRYELNPNGENYAHTYFGRVEIGGEDIVGGDSQLTIISKTDDVENINLKEQSEITGGAGWTYIPKGVEGVEENTLVLNKFNGKGIRAQSHRENAESRERLTIVVENNSTMINPNSCAMAIENMDVTICGPENKAVTLNLSTTKAYDGTDDDTKRPSNYSGLYICGTGRILICNNITVNATGGVAGVWFGYWDSEHPRSLETGGENSLYVINAALNGTATFGQLTSGGSVDGLPVHSGYYGEGISGINLRSVQTVQVITELDGNGKMPKVKGALNGYAPTPTASGNIGFGVYTSGSVYVSENASITAKGKGSGMKGAYTGLKCGDLEFRGTITAQGYHAGIEVYDFGADYDENGLITQTRFYTNSLRAYDKGVINATAYVTGSNLDSHGIWCGNLEAYDKAKITASAGASSSLLTDGDCGIMIMQLRRENGETKEFGGNLSVGYGATVTGQLLGRYKKPSTVDDSLCFGIMLASGNDVENDEYGGNGIIGGTVNAYGGRAGMNVGRSLDVNYGGVLNAGAVKGNNWSRIGLLLGGGSDYNTGLVDPSGNIYTALNVRGGKVNAVGREHAVRAPHCESTSTMNFPLEINCGGVLNATSDNTAVRGWYDATSFAAAVYAVNSDGEKGSINMWEGGELYAKMSGVAEYGKAIECTNLNVDRSAVFVTNVKNAAEYGIECERLGAFESEVSTNGSYAGLKTEDFYAENSKITSSGVANGALIKAYLQRDGECTFTATTDCGLYISDISNEVSFKQLGGKLKAVCTKGADGCGVYFGEFANDGVVEIGKNAEVVNGEFIEYPHTEFVANGPEAGIGSESPIVVRNADVSATGKFCGIGLFSDNAAKQVLDTNDRETINDTQAEPQPHDYENNVNVTAIATNTSKTSGACAIYGAQTVTLLNKVEGGSQAEQILFNRALGARVNSEAPDEAYSDVAAYINAGANNQGWREVKIVASVAIDLPADAIADYIKTCLNVPNTLNCYADTLEDVLNCGNLPYDVRLFVSEGRNDSGFNERDISLDWSIKSGRAFNPASGASNTYVWTVRTPIEGMSAKQLTGTVTLKNVKTAIRYRRSAPSNGIVIGEGYRLGVYVTSVDAQTLDEANDPIASRRFTYVSSRPAVASVNSLGRVNANAAGSATITVFSSATGAKVGSFTAKVVKPQAARVALDYNTQDRFFTASEIGTTFNITDVKAFGELGNDLNYTNLKTQFTWSTSDTSVIRIQTITPSAITVKIVGLGDANIIATAKDAGRQRGLKAVTVTDYAPPVTLYDSTLFTEAGPGLELTLYSNHGATFSPSLTVDDFVLFDRTSTRTTPISALFEIVAADVNIDGSTAVLKLKAKSGVAIRNNASYKLSVLVPMEISGGTGEVMSQTFTMKTVTAAKLKVTKQQAVNLYYDAASGYGFGRIYFDVGGAPVYDVTLASDSFEIYGSPNLFDKYIDIKLKNDDAARSSLKTAYTLTVTLMGAGEGGSGGVSKTVSGRISTVKTAPKLMIGTKTVYAKANEETDWLNVICTSGGIADAGNTYTVASGTTRDLLSGDIVAGDSIESDRFKFTPTKAGTLAFNFHSPVFYGTNAVKLTLAVKLPNSLSAAKATTPTLILNTNCTFIPAFTPFTVSGVSDGSRVVGIKEEVASRGITLDYPDTNTPGNCLRARFTDEGDPPANGTYRFSVTPLIALQGNDAKTVEGRPITINVKVTNAMPKISLKQVGAFDLTKNNTALIQVDITNLTPALKTDADMSGVLCQHFSSKAVYDSMHACELNYIGGKNYVTLERHVNYSTISKGKYTLGLELPFLTTDPMNTFLEAGIQNNGLNVTQSAAKIAVEYNGAKITTANRPKFNVSQERTYRNQSVALIYDASYAVRECTDITGIGLGKLTADQAQAFDFAITDAILPGIKSITIILKNPAALKSTTAGASGTLKLEVYQKNLSFGTAPVVVSIPYTICK